LISIIALKNLLLEKKIISEVSRKIAEILHDFDIKQTNENEIRTKGSYESFPSKKDIKKFLAFGNKF